MISECSKCGWRDVHYPNQRPHCPECNGYPKFDPHAAPVRPGDYAMVFVFLAGFVTGALVAALSGPW